MNRTNFRIKLDLCKYHKDLHRFCWIFIDSTKMADIKDIKDHIKGLFRINEPFDLFLNEVEYLPPNEDVRILKENETVLVLPKSQLSHIQLSSTQLTNQLHLSVSTPISSVETSKQENSSAHSEQIESTSINSSTSPKEPPQKEQLPINSPAAKSSPMQQECVADTIDKSQDTKENREVPYVCARRKRARRRRSSKLEQPLSNEEDKSKNPGTRPETIRGAHTTISPVHELTNLLSMVNNSTPPTFENNRAKNTVNAKYLSNEVNGVNASLANVSESIASNKKLGESKDFLNADFETYPVMTTKPKINNIIAFKMLKIGSDFTPQVSNFIVAEVVSCSPEKSLYIFKILQGLSEVQVPVGKFNCMEESEERAINDTIKLNYAQIMKPRLVSVSNTRYSFPSIS
ncbi:coilin isoform X2 [Bombus pyrosoma]|uniref:coilin isoform X2 n=1 Tax=Bombus pyrosoma TaxID=396416 RepID=UPI001CB98EDE|nr:coilin isoform X2 [Bombus pyrosoma]